MSASTLPKRPRNSARSEALSAEIHLARVSKHHRRAGASVFRIFREATDGVREERE